VPDPVLVPRTHPPHDGQQRDPLPRGAALLRGLLGWAVLSVGLGVAIGVALVLQQRLGLASAPRHLLQAGLMSLLVVPTVLVLRRRLDRRPLAALGWSRRAGRPLALGTGVGVVSAALVWVPAALAGWVRVDSLAPGAFGAFLLLNGVALLLFEALPEELALRGYTWTNLRDGWGTSFATLLTTALFPLAGSVSTGVTALVTVSLGTGGTPLQVIPDDPVVYLLQLVLFGLALVAARRIPVPGALWIAVAFHWTQLTVTRTLLGGLGWAPSGWQVTFVEPDALALVLVHIVVGGALFAVVRRLWSR
jgi:membrane protease YdiL (CAAX protease family)